MATYWFNLILGGAFLLLLSVSIGRDLRARRRRKIVENMAKVLNFKPMVEITLGPADVAALSEERPLQYMPNSYPWQHQDWTKP